MTNNHDLLSSLYENPLAAGAAPSELPLGTACHDRLLDYLLQGGLNGGSSVDLAAVASIPPRAHGEFSPVASMPHVLPRAHGAFWQVASMPSLPPRADIEFSPIASLPHVPPRAHGEFSPVASIPLIPPRA